DVARACLKAIFGQQPPLNCPYDFFLVGGAKMSSSNGVGVSARGMTDFLPPEVLRFLMIRTTPKHHVNFDSSEVHIIKVFNEFDRFHQRYFHDPKISIEDKRIYELSCVTMEPDHWVADFQLVSALIQLPHIDAVKELEKRKGSPFTELDRKHLDLRIRAAKYWIENYATEEEKTRLQETLPARAQELTATQRAFLQLLAKMLPQTDWEGGALQVCVFAATRLTPIDQPSAFKAIYRVLLDRDNGPKAGNFLSFLDKEFVVKRFSELPVDVLKFWEESSVSETVFQQWLEKEKANIASISGSPIWEKGTGVIEFSATMADGKKHCKRVMIERLKGTETALNDFENAARESISNFEKMAT
ncbi:MAG: Lysine--tRNA ligase, partial [Verrucomicrobiales bacterium]|nr:Lysine--tRNA ligase [Verrucomicrobiales bacterium]